MSGNIGGFSALALAMLIGCNVSEPDPTDDEEVVEADPVSLRIASFNVSLFGRNEGDLLIRFRDADDAQAQGVAAILQEIRPDVVLLNEVDWDAEGRGAQLLHSNYLQQAQGGREPLDYPYAYVAKSNTGVSSGLDLDNNGVAESQSGSVAYGNDSYGFGEYEGQYSFVVFSRFPIGADRTFQTFLWRDMPISKMPTDWYSTEAANAMRLSSKNHVDLPISVGDVDVHFLISHPTPPGFDGEEDRNGKRNHDEIRFWTDYIDGGTSSYHYDDSGQVGGLEASDSFVIAGDLNADPADGDASLNAIAELLTHPRVNDPEPRSEGAAQQASSQGGINASHSGDPALDTADWEDSSIGNRRVDYALPSADLTATSSGVFWPLSDDPAFELVGEHPFPVSDHRLVWVDLDVAQP